MTTPPVGQVGAGRARQSLIYRSGVLGRRPTIPTDFAELERRAAAAMSPRAWAYVAGGAGEGATMRANRAAFERHQIVPRLLPGHAQRDLTTELLGRRLPAPLLLAPVGAAGLVHRTSDLEIAAAAAISRSLVRWTNPAAPTGASSKGAGSRRPSSSVVRSRWAWPGSRRGTI